MVLPPLSVLRVAGPPRVDAVGGGRVAGVDVVMAVTNGRAGTLEELFAKRRQVPTRPDSARPGPARPVLARPDHGTAGGAEQDGAARPADDAVEAGAALARQQKSRE